MKSINDYKPQQDKLAWISEASSLEVQMIELFRFIERHFHKFDEIDQESFAAYKFWIMKNLSEKK